jgi:putative transposase
VDEVIKRAYPSTNAKQIDEGDTLMKDVRPKGSEVQELGEGTPGSILEEIAREGARRLLIEAMEGEVAEYIEKHEEKRNSEGRRLVVRNGYMPERDLVTGIGSLSFRQPRVDDRKLAELGEERFSSRILPRYLRRVPSVDNLIPVLYLKGISTGDFSEALEAILGPQAPGLSATNVVRLKAKWEEEYKSWSRRDLSGKEYVYIWVDGLHVNVRLDEERSCILVVMGADSEGKKEILAVSDGYRESKASWRELLLDLKRRGLSSGSMLAVGDGALGFWSALREVFPGTKEQRCWVHKTANVLDKLPKGVQGKAKSMIHEMYQAPTKEEALSAYHHFLKSWRDKYPKAVECLRKDEDQMFTFYDFPASHWIHIRTTNPIESTYATVRLRTKRTKGCGSRMATLTMVWKLAMEAEKSWRKLMGSNMIPLVMAGKEFKDGELKQVA